MKRKIAILFGGPSVEHEVSLLSTASFLAALDGERYRTILIGIDRQGGFLFGPESLERLRRGERGRPEAGRAAALLGAVEVAFPILHGPFGEDGTLQGFLRTVGVPFIGSGVLGSAVGLDKGVMKAVFSAAGLPQVRYRLLHRRDWEADPGQTAADLLGDLTLPFFVKPANSGSSVGITRVASAAELGPALAAAAAYDRRLIVEEGVTAREIEVGVLGNDRPEASRPGEVIPRGTFYDYQSKYVDPPEMRLPAPVEPGVEQRLRELAVQAFLACGARGLARVDFFLGPNGEIWLNEINTMPGLTQHSMYPGLWAASGLSYSQLIDRLIGLALEPY